jgi:hypothetical protein
MHAATVQLTSGVTHLAAVNLSRAMQIVGSHLRLDGCSDVSLVQRVRELPNSTPGDKALSGVPGLDGGTLLRPVEGLHWLSYATGPASRMISSICTCTGRSFAISACSITGMMARPIPRWG